VTSQSPHHGETRRSGSDRWRLILRDEGLSGSAAQAETLFALANGALGVRGGREEQASPTDGALLASVYEQVPIHYHEAFPGFARASDTRLPVADGKRIRIRLGEQALDVASGQRLACERALDLRRGRLERRTRWRTADGATVEVEARRLVPLRGDALLAIRLSVRSIDYSGPVVLESCIEASDTAIRADDPRIGSGTGAGLVVGERRIEGTSAVMTQAAPRSGIQVAISQTHRAATELAAGSPIVEEPRAVGQRFHARLEPGECVTLEKFVSWSSGAHPWHQVSHAITVANHATSRGYDALEAEQADAWAAFWMDADLGIDGDDSLEQALHFNLFHLRQSAPADGQHALPAKGLTGQGYEGHVFWDTDMFAVPVLQMTAPALARASLDWRSRTLVAARAHARELNHPRGALYAWRTIAGDEGSAYFPSGSAQYHINAAVAFAMRLNQLGGGAETLSADDACVLFETARIWMQIGHYNPRRGGAWCMHSVTGPDEYSALVDNDHYTNRMAQLHLRYAADSAARLAAEAPAEYAAIARSIGLEEGEPGEWRRAAAAMYLPLDRQLGVHPQDDGFLDKPRWPFPVDPADDRPLLLRYHPMTLYRYQVCKQPSVVLADVVAGEHVTREQKARDFDYYEALTVHDSSLSASTWSILAAELGRTERALEYFREGARLDLDDLHGNASHGAHMAAMAGTWLSLVWGFAGLRIAGDGALLFSPALPAAWSGYHFTILWRQRRLRVEVSRSGTRYRLDRGDPMQIVHAGEPLVVASGSETTRPLSAPFRPTRAPIRAVIFDLDGVLTDTATLHYAAWQRLADEIGVPFDRKANERLKGVDRAGSLDLILERASRPFGADEREALAERKNGYYRELIATFSPRDLFAGAREALVWLPTRGLRIGLASASRNAPALLDRLGIAALIDYVVDPTSVQRGKPAPDIFLAAAAALGVEPASCVAVEDAEAGIAAIKAAGMYAVGIGDREYLSAADFVAADIATLDVGRVLAEFRAPTGVAP